MDLNAWAMCVVLTSSLMQCSKSFQFNMTEYYQMPKMYNFDDYDQCLKQYSQRRSIYCFARAEVLQNNDSDSWKVIENISKFSNHHFNHRHLYFGLCVKWCETELSQLSEREQNHLFGGILTSNEKVNVYLEIFSGEEGNRQLYNKLINKCLNLQLKEKYGLLAESVVEYCSTNEDIVDLEDTWNVLFYILILVLMTLTTFSSVYDFYLKTKTNDKLLTDRDYYKIPVNGLGNKILVIFSIVRNWYRLNQEPNGKMGRDLRFLDCFKFFSMFLVIFAHTNWIIYESSISNPQDTEQMIHTAAGTLLMSGGVITVTFFVIGGFLLTINWIAITKNKTIASLKDYICIFWKFNIYRYIRLTIPYAVFVLISGIYFENSGGPLWRHIVEKEQLVCRKNWWINILYLNTFLRTNERCLLQGWYLAADTHSFIVSLIVLMMASRWPKINKILYSLTMIFFFVIPSILTYVNEYNGFFMPVLQSQKDSFINDEMFTDFYTPFYMNFGCYFSGVLAALIFDFISNNDIKLRQFMSFQVLWFALIPAGIFWIFTTQPMIQENYENIPLILRSIYSSLQRNVWGMGSAIFLIGMASKIGGVFRRFACLPIFRILGRLTYGAFLCHLIIARLAIGTLHEPIFFSNGTSFAFIFFNLISSYLISLLQALLLELPVTSFLNLMK